MVNDGLSKDTIKTYGGAGIHRAFVRYLDPQDWRNNPNDKRYAQVLKKTSKKPVGNKAVVFQEPKDVLVVNKKMPGANTPIPQQATTFDDFTDEDLEKSEE